MVYSEIMGSTHTVLFIWFLKTKRKPLKFDYLPFVLLIKLYSFLPDSFNTNHISIAFCHFIPTL